MPKKGYKQTAEHRKHVSEAGKKRAKEKPMSQETRDKIAHSSRGRPSARKGITGAYHHTEEMRKRLSELAKERAKNPEYRKKLSLALMGNKNMLGHKLSDEAKHKISLRFKGRKMTPEEIEHHRLARLGKKLSPESLAKRRLKTAGRAGYFSGHHHTAETKEKLRQQHTGNKYSLGRHQTEEAKSKMSQAKKGRPSSFLGKTHSEESKRKMSEKSLGRKMSPETIEKMRASAHRGADAPRWKGGGKFPKYGPGWKKARRETRERDHHVCVICGEESGSGKEINVHHIIRVVDCVSQKLEPNLLENLACLCDIHHHWADDHSEESIPHLQALLTERYGYQYYMGLPSQIISF